MSAEAAADRTVVFRGDGEPRSPAALVAALQGMAIERDTFSRGGAIAELEARFAEVLGKEAAIFCPTGTLANHLAIRRLCAGRPRVLIQEQSHIYNDTGDCVTRLSGITVVPLAKGRPAFTLDEVIAEVDRTETGRVVVPVGAVVIESPVRRQWGQMVRYEDMVAIAQYCREREIGLHLDGARLFMMSAATGIAVKEYGALFDTVYVSLYKYFGAPFGAILAGREGDIVDLYHERRMFGGGLPSAAIAAAAALRGLGGFEERFAAALRQGQALFAEVSRLPGADATPFEQGSNVFPLRLDTRVDRTAFVAALARHDVVVPAEGDPPAPFLPLAINTTILRRPNDELVAAFTDALAESRNG